MATTVTDPVSVATWRASHLIMSPYCKQQHLLDLKSIPEADQLLAKALKAFEPVRNDYHNADYSLAFNWPFVIDKLRHLTQQAGFKWKNMRLYIVVFRSLNPPGIDRKKLWALDEDAFTEAMEKGGLYRYWCGEPDEDGNNLSTCTYYRSLR